MAFTKSCLVVLSFIKKRGKRRKGKKNQSCKCLEWRLCYRGQDPAWEGWGQWWIVIPGPPGASNASVRYHLHKHCLCPALVPLSLPSFLCLNNQSFFPKPHPPIPVFRFSHKTRGGGVVQLSVLTCGRWAGDLGGNRRAKCWIFLENPDFRKVLG